MHGEYQSPNDKSSEETELVEVRDNVIPLHSKEKPVEHAIEHIMGEVGSHERSMYELSELGYSTLDEARQSLADLRAEKDKILQGFNKYMMLSALGKIKDKVFNQGKEVEKLTEVESNIHKLASAVAFTQATEHLAKHESSHRGSEEYKKAA